MKFILMWLSCGSSNVWRVDVIYPACRVLDRKYGEFTISAILFNEGELAVSLSEMGASLAVIILSRRVD